MKLHARSRRRYDDVPADAPPPARGGTTTGESAAWSRTPHTSTWAVLALIVGVVATVVALTGALAGAGVVLGVIAIVIGLIGLVTARRIHVTGRGVAGIALLFGLAAIVIGAVAIWGGLGWWDTSNQVTGLHDWLDTRAPWLVTGTE